MAEFIGTTLASAQKNGLAQDRYLENRLLEMIKLEKTEFPFQMLGKDHVIPANQGTKTVQFRRYLALPQFADGHALIEGIPPTEPLLTQATTVSATVAQYGAFMRLTDVQEALHIDNIKSIYQPELARHAAELIERDVIKVLKAESSVAAAGANGAIVATSTFVGSPQVLTWVHLRKLALYMKNQLRAGSAKAGGKPLVVVHPNVMQDLLDDAASKDYIFAAGQDNTPIKIGTLANYQLFGIIVQEALILDPVQYKNIPGSGSSATATTEAYVSIMLGKDPYIVTTLANGSVQFKMTGYEATKDDPLGQFSTVGYKLWTGAKVIDPLAIYSIYSSSAYGAAVITAPSPYDADTTVTGELASVKVGTNDKATQRAAFVVTFAQGTSQSAVVIANPVVDINNYRSYTVAEYAALAGISGSDGKFYNEEGMTNEVAGTVAVTANRTLYLKNAA